MKVLTVVFDLGKGGTQRAAQNFCEAYHVNGHESRIIALFEGGSRQKELLEAGLKVWVKLTKKNLDEIALWQPDLIHLHSHALPKEDVYAIKQICPEAKLIETNVFSKPSEYTDIIDFSYQLSEWCRFLFLARGGDLKKCFTVPYPVKVKSFGKATAEECFHFRKKHQIPQDAFLFGRIGQNLLGKWSPYLIDVFESFLLNENQNARLLLVNPPKEILDYVDIRNLAEKIVHIDNIIGDKELSICYSSIDLFLHIANQGESFGLVLAESLLCETPVITLNTPWDDNSQSEVIGNNVGGFCANTIEEFFHLTKKLYLNEALRMKLGRNGRERIAAKYDYLVVAQQSIDIIINGIENKDMTLSSALSGIKNHTSHKKQLTEFLITIKSQSLASHRLVNFLLKRLVNYNISRHLQR